MKKILSLLLLSTFTIASYAGTISIKDWYGTGFALKEGYVVTNYHVVDGATHVYIKGVGGDFSQEYAATVIEVDKENDLAIVKIDDSKFTGFGNIPYSIQTAAAEIGEDIFVLGYPMTDVMGEEIKLTTGVINSCSGYKGDNRSYQISAPIQPGNSGGPLFNKKGEVIGVVNAKLFGAENAGYAIKSQYLSKYLDTPSESDFSFISWVKSIKNDIRHFFTKRSLSNQSLVEQVKMVKNHVFIVKCCLKPKLYKIEYTTTNNKKLSLNSKKSVALHTFEEGKGTVYLLKPIVPEYIFSGRRTLKSVVIKNGITSIGDNAFQYCTSLTSVAIPDSVTSIGWYAFSGCTSLTSVTIGNSVTSIGRYAFCNCSSLTSVTIPDSVTSIGEEAFYYCRSLKSVIIGNSVTSIGDSAFSSCSSLTSVTIPDSVTTIGNCAFYNCTSLPNITIPNSVTSIGESAFYGCTSLTSVAIPDSVTSIGWYAFSGCTSLTSVTIPDSVTTIGNYAFYNCTSLPNITIPNSVTSIGKSAFYGCTSLTSVTIGNSVTSIGRYAFYGCTSLQSVTIGNSVTSIGEEAFYYCRSLKSVIIGNSVTSIGDSAFSSCSSLTSVTIPDSVTSIGDSAFYGCTSLTSVTIPDSVTKIGDYAFYNCTSLTSVYCKPTTPPTAGGGYMFGNNASGRKIYVPRNSVSAYKAAKYWSKYQSQIIPYNFNN